MTGRYLELMILLSDLRFGLESMLVTSNELDQDGEDGMASKYDPLAEHLLALSSNTDEITLTFQQLESVLGFVLPKSAVDYRQWWENPSNARNRPQAAAWARAGFKVDNVLLNKPGGWVRFRRL